MSKTIEAFDMPEVRAPHPRTLSFKPAQRSEYRPKVVSVDLPPTMTQQDVLTAEVARLKAELAAAQAKAKPAPKVSCKVSEKGAVSVYGLGRWPVTLYKGQWEALLAFAPTLKTFIEENASRLAVKE